MTLRVGSLFSGVGGFELGFERAGFEIAWQVEIDAAASNVLGHHWPDVPRYTDVKEVTLDRLTNDLGARAVIDVLVGGFPCQDVSLAGRRKGFSGGTTRSGLFYEFYRVALEFRPRWIVIENVPGLLSSWSGTSSAPGDVQPGDEWEGEEASDFEAVLATMVECGYCMAWRVLDAQHFGVPQRRRRVFLVGHLGSPLAAPAEVLFEPEIGGWDPAARKPARQDDPATAGRSTVGAGSGARVDALLASDGGPDVRQAQAGHLIVGVNHATPEVAGTLGSSRKGDGPRTDLERAGAFVVETREVIGSEWKGEVARTLTAGANGPRFDFDTESWVVEDSKTLQQGYSIYPESGQGADLCARETDVSPALTATGQAQVTDRGLFIAEAEEKVFRKSHRASNADDPEIWREAEVADTLNTHDYSVTRTTHAVVTPIDLRQATRTSGATGVGTPGTGIGEPGDPSPTICTTVPPAIAQALSVRRLTPIECERLQGFDDNWTLHRADGKTAADSVRYRQLGNAVAVVVSEWIAHRLLRVDALLHPIYERPES